MLISVHMPKTGGLSFRATLEAHYGDKFRHDYQDYPLASPPLERHRRALRQARETTLDDYVGVECIHGHFLPLKYLMLADQADCHFVTWLREPVERLVSHYDYWQSSYDPGSSLTSSLHRQVVEEQWTLEQFCLAPQLRNVYTEFLWAFPRQRLDFIGITEFFADDLRYFCNNFLGNNFAPQALNRRQQPLSEAHRAALDGGLRLRIEEYHQLDMAMYEQALALRERR